MNPKKTGLHANALFMTIPTAGSHPDMLEGIVETCGLLRERIVIIRTKPNVDVPSGCIVVDDFEPPNIQRWWKRGIDESAARGATAVAVLNDDLRIEPDTLEKLHDELLALEPHLVGVVEHLGRREFVLVAIELSPAADPRPDALDARQDAEVEGSAVDGLVVPY